MARTTRSKNLDLARWLNGGHERTTKKLSFITNANYLSKMATGDMEISDRKARQIEKTLDLPTGWLDRGNIGLLGMSAVEFDLHLHVTKHSDEAKHSLLGYFSHK